ncbi:hypothetical protein ACO0QE_001750 [Hanseniaspora vineae]
MTQEIEKNCSAVQLQLFEDHSIYRKFVLFDEVLPIRLQNFKKTYKPLKLVIEINGARVFENGVKLDKQSNSGLDHYYIQNVKQIFQEFVYSNHALMNQGRNNVIKFVFQFEVQKNQAQGDEENQEKDQDGEMKEAANEGSTEVLNEVVCSTNDSDSDPIVNNQMFQPKDKPKNNLLSFEPISPFVNESIVDEGKKKLADEQVETNSVYEKSKLLLNRHENRQHKIHETAISLPIYSVLSFKLKNVALKKQKKVISSVEIQPSKTLRYLDKIYGSGFGTQDAFLQIKDVFYSLVNDSSVKLLPIGFSKDTSLSAENVLLKSENEYALNFEVPYEHNSQIKVFINYRVCGSFLSCGKPHGKNSLLETGIDVEVAHKTKITIERNMSNSLVGLTGFSRTSRTNSVNNNMNNAVSNKTFGYNYATTSASSLLLPPTHTLAYDVNHSTEYGSYNRVSSNNSVSSYNINYMNNPHHNTINSALTNKFPSLVIDRVEGESEGGADNTVYAKVGEPFKVKFQLRYENSSNSLTELVIYQSINIPNFTPPPAAMSTGSNATHYNMGNAQSSRTSNPQSGFTSANTTTGMTSPIRMSELYMPGNSKKSFSGAPSHSLKSVMNQDIALSNRYYKWKKSLAQLPYQKGIVLLNNDYKISMETISRNTMEFQVELVGLQKGFYPNVHGLRIVNLNTSEITPFGSKLAVMIC